MRSASRRNLGMSKRARKERNFKTKTSPTSGCWWRGCAWFAGLRKKRITKDLNENQISWKDVPEINDSYDFASAHL